VLFEPCRGLTNEVAAHFFSSKYRSCSNPPITWLHNCVTIFAVMSTCHDITCESIPGSPPPFLFFFGARGEPGRNAKLGQLFCYYTGAVKHFDCTAQKAWALRNGVHYLKSGYVIYLIDGLYTHFTRPFPLLRKWVWLARLILSPVNWPKLSPMGDLVEMTAIMVRLGVVCSSYTSCDKILHLLRYFWPPHRGRNLKPTSLNSLVSMMYFHQNLILKTLWYDNSHTIQYTVLSTKSLSFPSTSSKLHLLHVSPAIRSGHTVLTLIYGMTKNNHISDCSTPTGMC